MGTGNKLDASQLCITDISKTRNCSLARVMRKELRDRGVKHLRVIYSPERQLTDARAHQRLDRVAAHAAKAEHGHMAAV